MLYQMNKSYYKFITGLIYWRDTQKNTLIVSIYEFYFLFEMQF